MIDTHAHLDFPDFDAGLGGFLERAASAGVEKILTIGTSVEGSLRAVALAETHESVHAVVGVHPGSAGECPSDAAARLRALARSPRVAAIGETGLDYHRLSGVENEDAEARAIQARIFTLQLDLACEMGLNVVVHERAAWGDTLAILRAYTGRLRAVFHCFGGSIEQAREIISLGHIVSFTGIVTFKNAKTAQETASQVPGEAYMVETDCPFLAPVPHRGKQCEPAHVRLVAEKIASLRGEPLERVDEQTTANAHQFFRLQQ